MDQPSMTSLERVIRREETIWINPKKQPFAAVRDTLPLSSGDITDAEERLRRFAPLIAELFPETRPQNGIIESELTEIPAMKAHLARQGGPDDDSRLFLKRDSDLPVAGSVKARGGIYEVLKHAETLAFHNGLLSGPNDDYRILASERARRFFGTQKIQVGSTGNLGLSIGIMSAALGFQAIVHMSSDAKLWKKDLLRANGVRVIEYAGDYGEAVARGRRESDADPTSYFVDDEHSKDLFLGYATAARRLESQFAAQNIRIDDAHPLFVTIPCGVGGAPGGIAFGLKHVFGDHVHVFFAEPTEACSMLVGLVTGKHHEISVQDVGLSGKTEADGLAVSRPSGFVGRVIEPLLSGEVTVRDERLLQDLRALWKSEAIFAEPSACAGFQGVRAFHTPEMRAYINRELPDGAENAVHLVWATGGRLVPEQMRREWIEETRS